MHIHRALLLVIILLLAGLLTACENEKATDTSDTLETPAEIAETVLEAINDGNMALAEQYFCEKDIATLQENPPTDIYPQFTRINCGGNETIVTCRYTISINNQSVESGVEATFDVQDTGTKICAVED